MKYGTNGIIPEFVNIGADGCSGISPLAGTSVWSRATQKSVQTCRSSCAFTLLPPLESVWAAVLAAWAMVGPPYWPTGAAHDAEPAGLRLGRGRRVPLQR